ncbi:hypothetical protein KAFR_0A08080 [Kazachstania africana CBS 2517]|uniref:Autophagy-related protein 2 n=1 Tax=Kazachstania africana (strain ATCC 22294 / BCRC 22015 / CBS 2517 / CECT 1963 / NBRC 1671 / NRRL Y-8276) TaxID=1071382 RepID=H2APE2_KAZAF|nr:hypothetical protein KAFR_0A08080 [Kazachstania africana CBS 2517]CCF56242.1 hypothetical protein KAFR_0A08080 [Kazachstania africana CBS 2517]
MGFWFSQGIQKRLLLYLLQQISLFSNLNLTNIDVSLGSKSKFSFKDVDLSVSEIEIPHIVVRSGKVQFLDLELTVSGGLDVKGKGISVDIHIPKCRPDSADSDSVGYSFSLAKSMHDLANSLVNLEEVQPTGEATIQIDDDTFDGLKKPSTLESVRNKVLNSALGNLSVILQDITIIVLDDDDEQILQQKLDKIRFTSKENNIRSILIEGVEISHFTGKEQQKYGDAPISEDNQLRDAMCSSKIGDASLYMSALDVQSLSIVENDKTSNKKLLNINKVSILFQGLASVSDLSILNLEIDVEHVDIHLENIIKITDTLFFNIMQIVMKELSSKQDVKNEDKFQQDVTKTLGYRRFQKEQADGTFNFLSFVRVNIISIHIVSGIALSFAQTYMNQLSNGDYIVKINSLGSGGNTLGSKKSGPGPIFQAKIRQNIELEILDELDINLKIYEIPLLVSFLKQLQGFVASLRNKALPKQTKSRSPSNMETSFKSNDIAVSLEMGDYKLSILCHPLSFNSKQGLLKTKKIGLLKHDNNSFKESLKLSDVSLSFYKNPQELGSFTKTLEESIVYTNILGNINHISVKDELNELQDLIADLSNLLSSVDMSPEITKKTDKRQNLRKSVQILNSSSIIYKHRYTATLILVVSTISWKLQDTGPNQMLGSFKGECLHNSLILSETENSVIFHSRNLQMDRILPDKTKENIISVAKPSSQLKPVLYISLDYTSSTHETRVIFNNVSIHYYSKWLDIIKKAANRRTEIYNPGNSKENNQTTKTAIDLKIAESSIILHPYRLKACLLVAIDQLISKINLEEFNIRGMIKSGTLLLIDDVSHIKKTHRGRTSLLSTYYVHRGFSTAGRIESACFNLKKMVKYLDVTLQISYIGLSVCADAFHTLIQLCIDLKYPETFPDEKMYRVEPRNPIDVFENVDKNFFDNLRSPDVANSPTNTKRSISMVESFLNGLTASGSDYTGTREMVKEAKDSSSSQGNASINLHEDYIDLKSDQIVAQEDKPYSSSEEKLKDIAIKVNLDIKKIILKLFDGFDWKYTRRLITTTVDEVSETAANMAEVVESSPGEDNTNQMLETSIFESIYITADKKGKDSLEKNLNKTIQEELTSNDRLNLYPSKTYKASINAENLKVLLFNLNTDNPTEEESDNSVDLTNKIELSVEKFEIMDNVMTSTWNKFLAPLKNESSLQHYPMLSLNYDMVRPIDYLAAIESIIDIKIAPLRLHVDQNTLDFLTRFFEFKDRRFQLIDEYPEQIFIQKFCMNRVKVKLDYKPKKVDYNGLKSGHASEFMNFFTLDGSTILLKDVKLIGVNGFEELGTILKNIWTPDITKKQLGGVIEGISPIKTLMSLSTGIKSLVTVLLSEYQNDDPHIRRTLKQNGNVFLRTTAGDFIKLSTKVVNGTQTILENTEELLGGKGMSLRAEYDLSTIDIDKLLCEDQLLGRNNPRVDGKGPTAVVIDASKSDSNNMVQPKIVSLYADQPLDIHKGLEEAYHSLEKHMSIAYNAIWRVRGDIRRNVQEGKGAKAAAVTVARAAPVAIIRPLIGATEALSKTLQGVVNQFNKEQAEDLKDKYKHIR